MTAAFLNESFFCAADTAEFCRRTAWPSPTWWRRCRSRARCSTSSASSRRSTRGWSSSPSVAATPCARVDLAGGRLESSCRRYLPLHRCCSHDALCLRPVRSGQITTEVFLHLRYEGTDCALMVTAAGYPSNAQSCQAGDFRSSFTKRLAIDLRTCTEASIIVQPALSLLCSTELMFLYKI